MDIILDQALKENLISKAQYENVATIAKTTQKTVAEVLLSENVLTEEKLLTLESNIFNIPVFQNLDLGEITNQILKFIPEESVKYYKIAPLKFNKKILSVGIINPDNMKAKEVLSFLARQQKIEIKTYLITQDQFKDIVKKYRDLQEVVGEALSEMQSGEVEYRNDTKRKKDGKPLTGLEDDAPVIKMVSAILRHGVDSLASDIHIEPTIDDLRIRFRVDGSLHSTLKIPLKTHPAVVARIKILSRLRIDETRIPQDGRFSVKLDFKEIDFRVSTFPTKLGEKIVIRILDPTEGLRSYKEIGLSPLSMEILKQEIKKPYGMILSNGPTGSGKTTTLYSILQELNKPDVNIVTLEDPIEYFVSGVNQSQVRPEIGYTFAKGLRSVVRQDPDIIMVGEIRDEESANLATHAALTGHIVLSTIHTNNAVGTISRLIDMKIRPFLIPSSLNIAIAQRLARRICPYCREKVRPEPNIEKMILEEISKMPKMSKNKIDLPKEIYVYKSKGCKKCNNKGEKGRIGIFEILIMNDELEKIIISNPQESALDRAAYNQGMITLRQDAIIKALQGKISIEEVLRVTDSD